MPSAPQTLVSVDLDDLACYHAIHGLPPPPPERAGVVLERCLPRFLAVFEAYGVRATFFVIGRDLQRDLDDSGRGAALLRRAVADGHELGNHSYAHAYDLTTWNAARQREDLQRCHALLTELGETPEGFRAPGYTHDGQLLGVAAALGYRYDSSALPSPAYYAAKIAMIGAMRVRGRRSQSMSSGASSFFGPRGPYRRKDAPLWELPISVTDKLRLPLIGTTVLGQYGGLQGPLRRRARRMPFLNLELHGLDLADPDRDGFDPRLLQVQPELKTPLQWRRDRLRELLGWRGGGRTLREWARSRA